MRTSNKSEGNATATASNKMVDLFEGELAKDFDKTLVPSKIALFETMKLTLCNAKPDSKVLCVGCGTGQEVFYLAKEFPKFTFVGVDPAQKMIDQLNAKLETFAQSSANKNLKFKERIETKVGFIESIPEGKSEDDKFDVVTVFLVTHFIENSEEKQKFFREVAKRMKPGADLFTADLVCNEIQGSSFIPAWRQNALNFRFPYKWIEKRSNVLYKPTAAEIAAYERKNAAIESDAEESSEMQKLMDNMTIEHTDDFRKYFTNAGLSYPQVIFQWFFIHSFHAKMLS